MKQQQTNKHTHTHTNTNKHKHTNTNTNTQTQTHKQTNKQTQVGKASQLKGFEIVKAVHIEPELFTVENDLLTPTLKLKRHQAAKHFKLNLDQMYADTKVA